MEDLNVTNRNRETLDSQDFTSVIYQEAKKIVAAITTIEQNVTTLAQEVADIPVPAYKTYVAVLSQTGTSAPTSVVLENTIGTIAVNYVSPGTYTITSANLFTADKTFAIINQSYSNATTEHTFCYISGTGIIFVETTDETGTWINGVLNKTAIEIRVYN